MRRALRPLVLLSMVGVALTASACGSSGRKPMPSVDRGWKQTGIASWYGQKFHGRMTANGEIYDMYGLTAAHKALPFNTLVEVENLDNGRRVQVRINDRGPFVRGRVIDLTYSAAEQIAMIGPGTARVRLRVVGDADLPGDHFVVQVGAFSEADAARALQRELEPHYPKVRIESAADIHRVLVGRFKKEKAARKLAERLRADGYDSFVRGAT